jgi:hypothetical protein
MPSNSRLDLTTAGSARRPGMSFGGGRRRSSLQQPKGPAPDNSPVDLLAAWVTHDRLHLHRLAGTLARCGPTRWAPLRADYAGPIPYDRAKGSP